MVAEPINSGMKAETNVKHAKQANAKLAQEEDGNVHHVDTENSLMGLDAEAFVKVELFQFKRFVPHVDQDVRDATSEDHLSVIFVKKDSSKEVTSVSLVQSEPSSLTENVNNAQSDVMNAQTSTPVTFVNSDSNFKITVNVFLLTLHQSVLPDSG